MNHDAIFTADLLGIILLATVLACNSWRIRDRSYENKVLLCLIVFGIVSCLVDSLTWYLNGTPGDTVRVVLYLSNGWLYFANVTASALWIFFIARHIGHRLSFAHRAVIILPLLAALAILIVNPFYPIAYSFDAANVYTRGPGYSLFNAVVLFFLCDGLGIYLYAKLHGGMLKYFPVWVYTTPIAIGALVQHAHYGVSMIWPCIAISIAGVVASLQNELMFRDKLTGLSNRFYFDSLKERVPLSRASSIGAMMVDLNNFKLINDIHGHSVGDQALKDAAAVMVDAVGTDGTVIRYAGDEFIILVNTQSEDVMDGFVDAVKDGFNDFNEASSGPYKLSASIGVGIFDLREQSMDEVMNEIDTRMYRSKRAYYMAHDRRRSR